MKQNEQYPLNRIGRGGFSGLLAAILIVSVLLVGRSGVSASRADSAGASADDDPAQAEGTPIAQLSPTPIIVQINSPTPLPLVAATITPTFTPAAVEQLQTSAMLQARESAGDVNVRFEANIDSNRVGTIKFGEQYIVTARFQRWFQIRFEDSPDGTGWVFDELVEIIGDVATIPDLARTPLPTANPVSIAATQAAMSLLLTPGAVLTATANTREITGPVAAINSQGTTVVDAQGAGLPDHTPLPTFTYPPEIAPQVTADPADTGALSDPDAATPEPEPTIESPFSLMPDNVPPIVPIAVLGGFGLLGLAVASLRR